MISVDLENWTMESSDLVTMGTGKFMEKAPNWQEREYMKFFMMNDEASQLSSTHPSPPIFIHLSSRDTGGQTGN